MLRDLFSLFPAYAGVIPPRVSLRQSSGPFPRICGGDPIYIPIYIYISIFSPHMRG